MTDKKLFQDGEEITAQLILDLLREVRDQQKSMAVAMQDGATEFKAHSRSDEEFHKKMLDAFPGGDPSGHRKYHDLVIEQIELRNKIIRECLINAAKVGFIAASGYLLYAIWTAIKYSATH